MCQRDEQWIHLFQILKTGKHSDGFTLYEVTSMVYPKSCPDGITKLVVWKRFNDFKVLHKEIKKKLKSLKINDSIPRLPSVSYFKRFSDRVIEERKKCALALLRFVANYPSLFMSEVFVKFFEASYVPVHQLKGNIDEIRSELHLPLTSDIISINSLSSDDERTTYNSDTDTISSRSSANFSISDHINHRFDSISLSSTNSDSWVQKPPKAAVSESHLPSIPESKNEIGELKISKDTELRYTLVAAEHFTNAVEAESAQDYDTAFKFYKLGISCLVNGVQSDPDLNRRETIRHKIDKYLLQAEKIYNMYLNLDLDQKCWNSNISRKIEESVRVERPLKELDNLKIEKIENFLMFVRDGLNADLFVLKSIRKPNNIYSRNSLPILPNNIPFMVKLFKYFNLENTVYLLLEFVSTKTLWDYIASQNIKSNVEQSTTVSSPKFSLSDSIVDVSFFSDPYISEETKQLVKDSQDLLNSVSEIIKRTKPPDVPKLVLENENQNSNNCDLSDSNLYGDGWSDECLKQWEPLPEYYIAKWAAQLIIALEHLHELGIICFNLQPKNLLIDDKGDLKLTYMYKWEHCEVPRCPKFPEIMYTAPEISTIKPLTASVDWWSFGVLLYEMLTGMPFYLCHPGGFTETTIMNIPNYVSKNAHALLLQILKYDPDERLGNGVNGVDAIKKHSFFNVIDWSNFQTNFL